MLKRGDIVMLPWPFTNDLSKQKPRPALVISSDRFNSTNQDAIFLFITTAEYNSPFDLRLQSNDPRLPLTGLKSASTFRTSKLLTLSKNMAKTRLGSVDSSLLSDIELRLKSVLSIS